MYRIQKLIIYVSLILIFGIVSCSVGQESKKQDKVDIQITKKEVIQAMKEKYIKTAKSEDGLQTQNKLKLKLVSPRNGGNVFTNKDLTHLRITMDSRDKGSKVIVVGARMTNINNIEFIEARKAPYILEFSDVPEGVHKFMVFSINEKGVYKSKVIKLNVKKITSFKIVPKG